MCCVCRYLVSELVRVSELVERVRVESACVCVHTDAHDLPLCAQKLRGRWRKPREVHISP